MYASVPYVAVEFPDVLVTAQDNLPLTTIQPDPDEYDDHYSYTWGDSHHEWDEEEDLGLVF